MAITLVTGAAGFIGREVCRVLSAHGVSVRALSRAPGTVEGVAERLCVDLADRAALRRAVQGVDRVVHLAARAHVVHEGPAAQDGYRRVNAYGTRNLLDACAAAGVDQFILVSTVKVLGEATAPGEVWSEDTPPAPVDAYGASKLEAESFVKAASARGDLGSVILRLPLVYGPGVKANMLRLFEWVERGIPLPLGGIDNRRSMVYVENVAAAIRHLLGRSSFGSETYFVTDGPPLATPELVRRIAWALERRARLVDVPESVLRFLGRAGDRVRRWIPFPLSTEIVRRLTDSLVVDGSRIGTCTGFAPPVTPDEGLRRTAAWFRASRKVRG